MSSEFSPFTPVENEVERQRVAVQRAIDTQRLCDIVEDWVVAGRLDATEIDEATRLYRDLGINPLMLLFAFQERRENPLREIPNHAPS
jgi:hypothetical protein